MEVGRLAGSSGTVTLVRCKMRCLTAASPIRLLCPGWLVRYTANTLKEVDAPDGSAGRCHGKSASAKSIRRST